MCVRKNSLRQVTLCDTLKLNGVSRGWKSQTETDRKLTKLCQKILQKSFLSNVTLFNALAQNTACDVCEKKFIKASYSM